MKSRALRCLETLLIIKNHHEVAYSFCLESYIFNASICIEQKIIGGALAQSATPLRGPCQVKNFSSGILEACPQCLHSLSHVIAELWRLSI